MGSDYLQPCDQHELSCCYSQAVASEAQCLGDLGEDGFDEDEHPVSQNTHSKVVI